MANTTISVRIDNEVKEQADKLFSELGMNISSAVNVFLKQAIREQAIPFKISINDETRIYNEAEKFVDEHIDAFRELAK
ncbi:DNA-damage-inducible protein J [Peptoniphilus olsenii]|uniref:DNA-damage-inducible protein J n=1 Tax=Peptoniphilus olsenii TaxID=411570 RepID=A0ABV2J738_9FIRM